MKRKTLFVLTEAGTTARSTCVILNRKKAGQKVRTHNTNKMNSGGHWRKQRRLQKTENTERGLQEQRNKQVTYWATRQLARAIEEPQNQFQVYKKLSRCKTQPNQFSAQDEAARSNLGATEAISSLIRSSAGAQHNQTNFQLRKKLQGAIKEPQSQYQV